MLRELNCTRVFAPAYNSRHLRRPCRALRPRLIASGQPWQPHPPLRTRSNSLFSRGKVWLGTAKFFVLQAFQVLQKLQVPASASLSTSAVLIVAVTVVLGVYTFGADQLFATFLLRFEQFRSTVI